MAATPSERKKPADHLGELKELVVGYAKQETWDPLSTLGRNIGLGLAGAFFVAGGSLFLILGTLRGLQSIDTFHLDTGAASLVPYAGAIVVGIVIVVLAVLAIVRGDKKGGRR